MTLTQYTLTASLEDDFDYTAVFAESDNEATLAAIGEIMDKAHRNKQGPWALGEIKLLGPSGDLLREMPAK